MNYIMQLNSFYNLLITKPLNSNAICLYGILLNINNKSSLGNWFSVANITIQALSGMSKNQLIRARNELIQKEYIRYKKNNESGKYYIERIVENGTQGVTSFDTDSATTTDDITKCVTDDYTNSVTDGVTSDVTETESVTDGVTKNDTTAGLEISADNEIEHAREVENESKINRGADEVTPSIYNNININKNNKDRVKKFNPPSLKEVQAYCLERKNKVDAQSFIDYYTSINWYVGKSKMKDWKAAVRTWENRIKKDKTGSESNEFRY